MRTAFLAALSVLLATAAMWSFAEARNLDLATLDFNLFQPLDTERYEKPN